MAPNWPPLRAAMQRYCEPYFNAVTKWSEYKDEDLMFNRIMLIETAVTIFREYSQSTDDYNFDIQFTNASAKLLPEVQPTGGKLPVEGGDMIAFKTAMRSTPGNLFQKAGVFFQNGLLKALACWNENLLSISNITNRDSISAAIDKLFCIPEDAGKAFFIYQLRSGVGEQAYIDFPFTEISQPGSVFFAFLLEYRKEVQAAQSNGGKKKGSSNGKASGDRIATTKKSSASGDAKQQKKENGWGKKDAPIMWIKNPKKYDGETMIGKRIVGYFPDPENPSGPRIPYDGTVVWFAPPSSKKADDALYHIKFDDGDEEDYDRENVEEGIKRYNYLHENSWDENHASVGNAVGAYFPNPDYVPGGPKDVPKKAFFEGKVTRYCGPTSADECDELYHVLWEDGDEQDFDRNDFHEAVALYKKERKGLGGGGKKGKARAPAQEVAQEEEKEGEDNVQMEDGVSTSSRSFGNGNLVDNTKTLSQKGKKSKEKQESLGKSGETKANRPSKSSKGSEDKKGGPAPKKKKDSDEGTKVAKNNSKTPKTENRTVVNLESDTDEDKGGGGITEEQKQLEAEGWTTDHPSVGDLVCEEFQVSEDEAESSSSSSSSSAASATSGSRRGSKRKRVRVMKPFKGRVARYVPPESPSRAGMRGEEGGQMYHIVWEDGDEQDCDQDEYDRFRMLFIHHFPDLADAPVAVGSVPEPHPTAGLTSASPTAITGGVEAPTSSASRASDSLHSHSPASSFAPYSSSSSSCSSAPSAAALPAAAPTHPVGRRAPEKGEIFVGTDAGVGTGVSTTPTASAAGVSVADDWVVVDKHALPPPPPEVLPANTDSSNSTPAFAAASATATATDAALPSISAAIPATITAAAAAVVVDCDHAPEEPVHYEEGAILRETLPDIENEPTALDAGEEEEEEKEEEAAAIGAVTEEVGVEAEKEMLEIQQGELETMPTLPAASGESPDGMSGAPPFVTSFSVSTSFSSSSSSSVPASAFPGESSVEDTAVHASLASVPSLAEE